MGLKNMRAICPNCGGKIHTQPRGFLGSIAIGANGVLVKTGTTCELCGVTLTGRVTPTNYAVLADRSGDSRRNGPEGETREEYLQRMNSTKLGAPKRR
jgi:hypothetical protein